MIAASGGCTRGRVERLLAGRGGATTSKPASRRTTRSARMICGSSSQTSTRGTAFIARASVARSPCGGGARRLHLERQLDHERGSLAGQRLGPDVAAVGLDEPPGDRQPEARAAVADERADSPR